MADINWWHVLTYVLFLASFPFLIYVMTFVALEIGTFLGFIFYLIRF